MLCRPHTRIPRRLHRLGIRHAHAKRPKVSEWNNELLEVCEKYPLSVALGNKGEVGNKKIQDYPSAETPHKDGRNFYFRTQIVSPDLCDDVLKYIGPSLEKHRGCDILDLNPGAGLWSQKLHDFLQPRSHVLLDPAPDRFDEYLRPLLEKPGSKYKLITADTTKYGTYQKLAEDGVFPLQARRDPRDPESQKPNDSLLVTGSLMWQPKLPGHGFDSMARQLYMWATSQAPRNSGFHMFGPVRSLLWMAHEESNFCIPRSTFHCTKSSLVLDLVSKQTEVVTGGHTVRGQGRATIGREPHYEIESIIKAMQRGKAAGIELPSHRRENVHDFAEEFNNSTDGTGIIDPESLYEYLKEQEMAGKSTVGLVTGNTIESYKYDKMIKDDPLVFKEKTINAKGKPFWAVTKEGRHVNSLRSVATRQRINKLKMDHLTSLAEEVYKLECTILKMGNDGAEKEEKLQHIQKLEDEFATGLLEINENDRSMIYSMIDDRIALRSGIPRLQWDMRPYEPLVMQPNEVWPANRVSLFDSEPRPCHEDLTGLQDFIFNIAEKPSISVKMALANLQHGAEDIIEQAPSLKDATKGGRLNMDHLRVRMLTVEMLKELYKAYQEWPFRIAGSSFSINY